MSEQMQLLGGLNNGRTDLGDDCWVHYEPSWLTGPQQTALTRFLTSQNHWQQETKWLYGREVKQPRLTAWFGRGFTWDSNYSKPRTDTVPMEGLIAAINARLAAMFDDEPNACLANWYRDGSDSVGWHQDNEPSIYPRSPISSVSLGTRRRFLWRKADDHSQVMEVPLGHGDLIVMGGAFQQHWEHSIAKTTDQVGSRINLTFRRYYEGH